jgi:hypothetical protein
VMMEFVLVLLNDIRDVLEIGLYENIVHEKVTVISGELERQAI